MQAPALGMTPVRDWRTWLAVLKRAALYTVPFLFLEIDVFDFELVPWMMFLALLPVAAYRVLHVSTGTRGEFSTS